MILKEINSSLMSIYDINSEYYGISGSLLMENAGAEISRFISHQTQAVSKIGFFCGSGGNGGDGFVAARHLPRQYDIDVFWIGPESRIRSKPALKNLAILKKLPHISLQEIKDSSQIGSINIQQYDIIVDGLLGTGLQQNRLREPIKSLLLHIMSQRKKNAIVISIDVPTGLKNNGTPANTIINPDYTIVLHQPKLGTYKYGGTIHLAPIGIPPEAIEFTGPGLFNNFPIRSNDSHKGQNGKLLIIGGSETYHGAPVLAAKAALALHTDLVTIFVPDVIVSPIRALDPGYIVSSYASNYFTMSALAQLEPILQNVDTVLLGPGIGTEDETFHAIQNLLSKWTPDFPQLVIDADALKALQTSLIPEYTILTPHAGEFRQLTKLQLPSVKQIKARLQAIQEISEKFSPTVTWLVKGSTDIIFQGGKYYHNLTGLPAMTAGGTGDILAGVTAAFYSKTKNSFEAASMASFITGLAAEQLIQDRPFDIISLLNYLPVVLQEIFKFIKGDSSRLI